MSVPFYTPGLRVPPVAHAPGERLWTLARADLRLTCELRDHGSLGCDARLLQNGGFVKSRLFRHRADALAHAATVRERLAGEGWTPVDGPTYD